MRTGWGISAAKSMETRVRMLLMIRILSQPCYSGKWKKCWEKGFKFSQSLFDDRQIWLADLPSQVPCLETAIFFLQGHHDFDTPWQLVEMYYHQLEAPSKQLYWFEHSSHFPFYEEADKFNGLVIDIAHKMKDISKNSREIKLLPLSDWISGFSRGRPSSP